MTERFTCTAENPWSKDKSKHAIHPDAEELMQEDGWPCGDIVTYKCPNCNLRFKVELPQ